MKFIFKACFILVAAASLAPCFAQQAGSRDLTLFWRAPEDHVASPSSEACPAVRSTISHGSIVNGVPTPDAAAEQPTKIELTIVKVVPAKLRVGEGFTATIRLKNAGDAAVRIPWQPDGEGVVHPSPEGTEQYEVADVTFRLGAVGKNGPATPLESEGALFAQPADPASYIAVAPDHWITLTLKGSVACGLLHCVGDIRPREHAILIASWYQRVLTHSVTGCAEDHGAYTVRELDSAPLPVTVEPRPGAGQSHSGQKNPNSFSGRPRAPVVPQVRSLRSRNTTRQQPV
jgi:hypothetical protein